MGAGATIVPSRGGKRPLDAAFNLVPFIDLLSCCISFLLITAVWTQVASMKVEGRESACSECGTDTPAKVPRLVVAPSGYSFQSAAGDAIDIPRRGEAVDRGRLAEVLHGQTVPDKAIDVRVDDGIRYEDIVQAMDVAKAAGFGAVSVQPI